MKRALIITLACLLCNHCDDLPATSKLDGIESIIQNDPSTAYAELKSFDKSKLTRDKDYARYCLLLSMALDKNYIDICSDSLISPAVQYFSHTRDYYYKFLSYYYKGRIHENSEEYALAIQSYIDASTVPDKYIPLEYLVRLHTRKGTVYYHQFALDKALEEVEEEKKLAEFVEDPVFYVYGAIDVAAILESMNRKQEAYKELESLNLWMSDHSITPPLTYYSLWLRVLLDITSDIKEIQSAYNDYASSCFAQETEMDHLLVAKYYLRCDKTDLASQELGYIKDKSDSLDSFAYILYHSLMSSIHIMKGEFKEALSSVQAFNSRFQAINLEIHNNDVRFLEERAKKEMEMAESRHRNSLLVILLIISGLILALTIFWYIRSKREFDAELEKAKNEYNYLQVITESEEMHPNEIHAVISDRLQALRPYIFSGKPLLYSEQRNKLKATNEKRSDMLCSIGLIYAASYPKFVSKLSSYGLTATEIGLCCMYLSGYSAKELNYKNNTTQSYKENLVIRQKIGLEPNGIKLTTWLKDLFDVSVHNKDNNLNQGEKA